MTSGPVKTLRTVGLFAGVGALERGLEQCGHVPTLLAEIDPAAQAVLKRRFPKADVVGDVRTIKALRPCDLVSAGFPCQDLSQCGKTAGIEGRNSSLVREVFRLVETAQTRPDWLLIENVPFMLRLERGRAMTLIVGELERLGYRWAYRTIDARAFGVPQRRRRVVLVAGRNEQNDARRVLFSDTGTEPCDPRDAGAYGFYWTEGNNGLGWGVDCVPTLKGGSSFGIPSPPAIWLPQERRIVTIDIRDAERLQGLPADWTLPAAESEGRAGARWRLVGNAVCVPMAAWIGRRLLRQGTFRLGLGELISRNGPWPPAACGNGDGAWEVRASAWPVAKKRWSILEFLRHPVRPLSARATAGFLSRAKKSRLRFADGFLEDVAFHLATVSGMRTLLAAPKT
jgi:DNA (cytosine-5)-methyltransferase 1